MSILGRFFLPCFSLALCVISVSAQPTQNLAPIHIGPFGGTVGRIVTVPGRPDLMFLVDRSRVFKSTNSGHSWYDVTPDSLTEFDGTRLNISLQNSDRMTLTGRGQKYFSSTNAGETWENHDVSYTQSGSYFQSITYVDPDDLSFVLAYESGSEWSWLIRSLDGGLTWDSGFIEEGRHMFYLWINPINPSMMIAGTSEDFLSMDGGRSWSMFDDDLDHSYFYSFDPNDSRIFYRRTRDGSFKTRDSGGTWSRIGHLPDGLEFKTITVATGWSDHLYGVTDEDSETIYTSYDGGNTWTELWRIQSDRTIESISVPESAPDFPFVSIRGSGLYQFTESDSWISRNSGLSLTEIRSLVTISADRLLISVSGFGFLMTNNGGVTWDTPVGNFNAVYQSKMNPRVIITHEVSGIFGISTDGALSWRWLWFPFNPPRTMAVSGDASTIYASIPRVQEGDDIVKSIDGGVTWQELGQLVAPWTNGIWRGMYKIEIHPDDSNILFARAEVSDQQDLQMHTAILKSTDGAVSWSIVERDLTGFEVNRADPHRMYYHVDADRSFHRSTDGGNTWQKLENIPGSPEVRAFVSHPEDPDLLFVGTSDNRILLSRDNAFTWMQLAGPTADASLSGYNSFSIPADDPTILYAGTGGDGVLKFDISSVVSTGIGSYADRELPLKFELFPNYPNPFNSRTVISYSLPKSDHVRLEVYDLIGRRVLVLKDQREPPGRHDIHLSSKSLPSGTYFYTLRTGSFSDTKMMTVVN